MKTEAKKKAKRAKWASLPPVDINQRYSIDETIDYLRSSRQSVYALIGAGELRVIKEGKRTFVPGSEIARRSTLPALQA